MARTPIKLSIGYISANVVYYVAYGVCCLFFPHVLVVGLQYPLVGNSLWLWGVLSLVTAGVNAWYLRRPKEGNFYYAVGVAVGLQSAFTVFILLNFLLSGGDLGRVISNAWILTMHALMLYWRWNRRRVEQEIENRVVAQIIRATLHEPTPAPESAPAPKDP